MSRAAPAVSSPAPSGLVSAALASATPSGTSRMSGELSPIIMPSALGGGKPIAIPGGPANATYTTPFRDPARIVAVCLRLTTDATVASRNPWVRVTNPSGDETYLIGVTGLDQSAGFTCDYVFGAGWGSGVYGVNISGTQCVISGLSGVYVPENSILTVGVTSGVVGDILARISVLAAAGWG